MARGLWLGLSLIGLLSFAQFAWVSVLRDGGFAYDFHAYLLAGWKLLDGTPLYGPKEINDPGAYRYPPTFALLIVPRTDWLAFTAAAIAVPTLWVARLAAATGVPRLLLEEIASRAGVDQTSRRVETAARRRA